MAKMRGKPTDSPVKPRRTRAKKPGSGVIGEASVKPEALRADLALQRRAIRERWPGWEQLREKVEETALKFLTGKSDRNKRAGLLAGLVMSRQVQADEHLEARLQNTGVALIKFRETVTNPDGTTTTTERETMKLYSQDTPMEAV